MNRPCDQEDLIREMRLDIKKLLVEVAEIRTERRSSARWTGSIWGGVVAFIMNLAIYFVKGKS